MFTFKDVVATGFFGIILVGFVVACGQAPLTLLIGVVAATILASRFLN